MAFKRSFLESLGLSEQQVSAVMDEHIAVVDALKADRDKYKAEADKVADLQKELEGIKGGEDFKKKYEDEHESFENFKKKVAEEAETAKVQAAYRSLLVDEKIGAKWLDDIMRITDFTRMKIDKDGKLVDEAELRKTIGEKCSAFKTTITEKGAKVEAPPVTANAGKLSKEDIFKRDEHGRYVLSTEERQKAIQENPDAFRKG